MIYHSLKGNWKIIPPPHIKSFRPQSVIIRAVDRLQCRIKKKTEMMETACYPVIQLMVKRANPDGGTMEFQAQPEGTWGGSGKGRNSGRKVVGSSALDRPYELHKNRSWRDVKATSCSLAQFCLFATPCTISHQAPLSIGFPKLDYWGRLPFPSPGHLQTHS